MLKKYVKERRYIRGRRFEYRVRDHFKKHGFLVIRSAQSKPLDLVCLKNGYIVLVECKVGRTKLGETEKAKFLAMAETAGATPVLAYRLNQKMFLVNVETGQLFLFLG